MGILGELLGERKSSQERISRAKADIEKLWQELKVNAERGFELNAYDSERSEFVKLFLETFEFNLQRLWVRAAELEKADPESCATDLTIFHNLLLCMSLTQGLITCAAFDRNGLSKENFSAVQSQAEAAFAVLKKSKEQARKGGINSGRKRKTDANELWGLDALKLAQMITAETPSITQEDLADQIRQRWTLKVKLPRSRSYIVEQIRQWERHGKLERTRLRRSKNLPTYTH